MLVLSRKVGQEIVIGDNVRITITKVSGNRVTLGVDAPEDVRILRGELEPIARSFEEESDAPARGVVHRTIPLMDDVSNNTIPFAPNAAR